MKVLIVGASRGVGRCLLERALAQHHQVTAAIRNPAAVDIRHAQLHVEPCDVLDAEAGDPRTRRTGCGVLHYWR